MSHQKKILNPINPDTLFRFQMVSTVQCREHTGESRALAVAAMAGTSHTTINGKLRKPSVRSLYRWLAAYEAEGFDGLLPIKRTKVEGSTVLSMTLLEYCKGQKEIDPCASLPELIDRAKEEGLVAPGKKINRSTLWCALKSMGVDTSRRKSIDHGNKRRFSFPHRLDMVLCDGKHFRAGGNGLKRVALFFLDDATRMLLGVVVGTSESAELFLRGLHKVVERYGKMTRLYVDNGSGFRAHDSIAVLGNLGIHFIHGTAGYPQGHGKIERFNQTIKGRLLRHMHSPDIDPEPMALELRLEHYTDTIYNRASHESLVGESPWERFKVDSRLLDFMQNRDVLRQKFILHENRRVSPDNIISIDGVGYEIMCGYAGAIIQVRRNVLDGTISMIHEGKIVRLAPVELHTNATQKRRSGKNNETESKTVPAKCAATIAYKKDYSSIVDPDGGYSGSDNS